MSGKAKERRQKRRAHAQAATAKQRTLGQRQARAELLELADRHPSLLSVTDLHVGKGEFHARVRIDTRHIERVAAGLPIATDHEDVELWFDGTYPNRPPTALVSHDGFLGHPTSSSAASSASISTPTANGIPPSAQLRTVDVWTVAEFTSVPLALGLALVAAVTRSRNGLVRVARWLAVVLWLITILVMTVPADFDTATTIALSVCHLTLIPIIVVVLAEIERHSADVVDAAMSGAVRS